MDCRFYDTSHSHEPQHCVSDATYTALLPVPIHTPIPLPVPTPYTITDIHYGVRCDRETIFANQGITFATTDPVTHTTSDHIRPLTSAVPETEILYADALIKAGTYTSNLFLDEKAMTNGTCHISLQ